MHGMEEMILAIDAAIQAGEIMNADSEPVFLSIQENEAFKVLDEGQSKSALARHGLSFPKMATAANLNEVQEVIRSLSFPVVLKGLGIAHKSEAGAVVLNLKTPDEVHAAASTMKGVTGFLVEEMVATPVAEVLVGITRDTTGVMMLTVGSGGVLTELLEDTASLIVPSGRKEIAQAIKGLKLAKLLEGYRGKPAADMDALLEAIMAVQSFCLNSPDLIELDVNPIMALENGAMAVDALVRIQA